jgi:hypothetical protein
LIIKRGEGSTIILALRGGGALSKCVIFTLFWHFVTKWFLRIRQCVHSICFEAKETGSFGNYVLKNIEIFIPIHPLKGSVKDGVWSTSLYLKSFHFFHRMCIKTSCLIEKYE